MTPFRPLDDQFLVAPQLEAEDFARAKELGVTCIVNNRPDGEEPGCLQHGEAAQAAAAAGLNYQYLPMHHGGIDPSDLATLKSLIDSESGRILAYCRSGTRSSMLWALAMAGTKPVATIIQQGLAQGYDLRMLEPTLHHLAQQHNGQERGA